MNTHADQPSSLTLATGSKLSLASPLVMGILNITPDSFSDGGSFLNVDTATSQAMRMLEDGADIIDVGGESTRPGAEPVTAQQQIKRVVPVISKIADALNSNHFDRTIAISIDTTSAAVAQAAFEVGATILNDVSAGLEDPDMFKLAARIGCPLVLMHMQGNPKTMQTNPHYDDVVQEVRDFLLERANFAQEAGVAASQIVIDPGIGFGKTREHNLVLLAHLDELVATGYPVLLGTSRKRFMGSLCRASWRNAASDVKAAPPAPDTLVGATCATTAAGVAQGVKLFRVHDVMPNRQAADVAWAMQQCK